MWLSNSIDLIKYFELAAAVVGFINFKKLKGTVWSYLPFFLLLLFSLEYYGYLLAKAKHFKENINLYKYVVIPIIFYFYSYLFFKILPKKDNKVIIVGLLIFTIASFLEYTVLSNYHSFYSSLSLSISNLFFLIYVLRYYINLVNSNQLIYFYKLVSFWVCTGLLIFYLGCLPYFALYNILAVKYFKTIFIYYAWVFVVLNYLMYLSFIIGFIWNKKEY